MSEQRYVYKQTEMHEFGGLWTVGFYLPDGKWEPESDHDSSEKAAARVHYLNGGTLPTDPTLTPARDVAVKRWGWWNRQTDLVSVDPLARTEELAREWAGDNETPVPVWLTYRVPEGGTTPDGVGTRSKASGGKARG